MTERRTSHNLLSPGSRCFPFFKDGERSCGRLGGKRTPDPPRVLRSTSSFPVSAFYAYAGSWIKSYGGGALRDAATGHFAASPWVRHWSPRGADSCFGGAQASLFELGSALALCDVAADLEKQHQSPKQRPEADDDHPDSPELGDALLKLRIRNVVLGKIHACSYKAGAGDYRGGRDTENPVLLEEADKGDHNGKEHHHGQCNTGIHKVRMGRAAGTRGLMGRLFLFHVDTFECVTFVDRVNHVLSRDHVAKDGVFSVQVRLRGAGDEKLAAVRVGACVGH